MTVIHKPNIEVEILREAGYEEALMGMATSYKDPALSREDWWTPDAFDRASKRAPKLAHMDGGHNKFLESMEMWIWVRAPRGWWQEADTYRLATKQSESTMHTITKRELTQADFNLPLPVEYLRFLNDCVASKDWYALKQYLPEGFMQGRVWKTSYKTMRNVLAQRQSHRLPEWPEFYKQILEQAEHPEFLVKP